MYDMKKFLDAVLETRAAQSIAGLETTVDQLAEELLRNFPTGKS